MTLQLDRLGKKKTTSGKNETSNLERQLFYIHLQTSIKYIHMAQQPYCQCIIVSICICICMFFFTICAYEVSKRMWPHKTSENVFISPFVFLRLDSNQMNNLAQTSTLIAQPYPAVGQITSPYEQQKPVKDLNKYATLKAVGKDFAVFSAHRSVERAASGTNTPSELPSCYLSELWTQWICNLSHCGGMRLWVLRGGKFSSQIVEFWNIVWNSSHNKCGRLVFRPRILLMQHL